MEPISPGPRPSAEKMGSPNIIDAKGSEQSLALSRPEKELKEPIAEPLGAASHSIIMPILPAPAQTKGASIQTVATSDTPLVANDDDVMEKEWVQKAKKIVAETRDDPYRQEKEVSKLQADYVKKRYGKEIKVTDD